MAKASGNREIASQGRLNAGDVVFDASDFAKLEEAFEEGKQRSYTSGYEEGRNDEKSSRNIELLGSNVSNIDIKALYPDEYQNFTNDNFWFRCRDGAQENGYTAERFGGWNGQYYAPYVSYNAETGLLTVFRGRARSDGYWSVTSWGNIDVYLIR